MWSLVKRYFTTGGAPSFTISNFEDSFVGGTRAHYRYALPEKFMRYLKDTLYKKISRHQNADRMRGHHLCYAVAQNKEVPSNEFRWIRLPHKVELCLGDE
jgi:hypothetical protein